MKKELVLLTLALILLSCGNKSREKEPLIYGKQPVVEQSEPDTVATAVQNEAPKVEEKSSAPVSSSSSSRSHKSRNYDRSATKGDACQSKNMRGFDPASEDDMDDNGMNRYMENNDEEGWD